MEIKMPDFSIFEKFKFDIKPVVVKFLTKTPDTIARLNRSMALCEMLREAQQGNSFYADIKNHTCEAGPYVLGQAEAPEQFINGEFGAGLKIYEGSRSASRLYLHVPRIGKGVINYVAFSPLEKLSFDPDLLILLADPGQTEILLRAMSYKTGQIWHSRTTPAIGCAWIFVYPYLTGDLNYIITGFGHGMKRRKLFPEGKQIVSIPFDLLPNITASLREMQWVLPAYEPDGMEYVARLLDDLGLSKT